MTIGIIIQARNGSTRLPYKMILPFYKGIGILETILLRLKEAKLEIPIIVATTVNPNDDIIAKIADKQDIKVFRGSENDVLSRFIYSAEENSIQKIIRICADNPFLDITALEHQIECFKELEVDYCCYSKSDKTPTIKTHYGFWTEGVTLDALNKVARFTGETLFKEHVTNYIYTNPEKFRIHFENIHQLVENETHIRLTIDTVKDFELAKEIYSDFLINQIPFNAENMISYIKSKHDWLEIMKNQIIENTK